MAFSWWQNMIFRLVTSMGQRKSSEHSWGIRFLCCDALTLSHRDYQSCQQRRVRQRHDNQLYLYPVFYILWQLAQSLKNNVVTTVDIKKLLFFFSIQTSSKTFFYILFRACSMHAGRVSVELRSRPRSPSLWLSGRASEREIRRSKVRILMRTKNFFFHARNKTRSILLLIQNLVFNIWSLLQTENNVN